MIRYLLLSITCFISSFIFSQVVTTPPAGTVFTTSSANPFAIAMAGGQTYTHTNSTWPAFVNNCYIFAINDTLFNAINGFNPTPSGGPCSGMSNLDYSSLLSNPAAGTLIYKGTTSFRYKNTSSVFVVNNNVQVRATVQFSAPITYYPNNTFILPVTANFSYTVLYECLAPADGLYTTVTPGTWVPAKDLFDDMDTDPANSICVFFQDGYYTLHSVSASTSPSATLCEGFNLQLIGGGTGNNLTFSWTGPNSFTSNISNPIINNASPFNSGTYTLTATDDAGCPNSVNTLITIDPAPVATSGGSQTICVNSPATVSGMTAQYGTISWTHNGSGNLTGTSTTTPTYTPSPIDANNTVTLTMTVTSNNSCAPNTATSTYNFIVQGNPVATDGVTSSTCSGTTYTITSANSMNGTIQWTHNGSGTLTNSTTNNPSYTPGPLDDGNTVVLIMTVTSNNLCAPGTAMAFHILNIIPLPVAVAGGVGTVCENDSIQVSGAMGSFGTINWTENGAGSLLNPTTTTPIYVANTGDIGNIVTLTMTVTSSACSASASADFTVHVQGLPSATITSSLTMCAGLSATVSGVSIKNGTFSWSHDGNGILSNNGSLTPTYGSTLADGGDTVHLTLTVYSNNSCAPATYTTIYNVIVDNVPVATIPTSTVICGGIPFVVNNVTMNYGNPTWSLTTGAGSLTNANTPTPTYTPAPADYGQNIILSLNLASNNSCAPNILTQFMYITVQNPPVAQAGGINVICENSNAGVTGATAMYGTINWTHDGAGTLTNPTTLGPFYQPSSTDIGDTVTLLLVVTSNNSCAPLADSAEYYIVVDPLPVVSAGFTNIICSNAPFVITGATSNYGSINWSHNGFGTLTDQTTITPTYTPVFADENDTVLLVIHVQSNNACAPTTVKDSVWLIVDPAPTLTLASNQDTTCPLSSYVVSGTVITNGTYTWSHNGTGTLSNTTTPNPTYLAGSGDTGNHVYLTCTVTGANGCSSVVVKDSIDLFIQSNLNAPVITVNSIQNVACFGGSTGSISLSATGGTLPYSWSWSSDDSTQTIASSPSISSLIAGTYIVNLVDGYNCLVIDTFQITEATQIVSNPIITPVDCVNLTAGKILVAASGGVGPYTYLWLENGTTADTLSGVPAGNHLVQITDASGCIVTDTIALTTNGDLNVQATPNQTTVNIATPINFTASGATSYYWSPSDYLSCTACPNPICTPLSTTTYIVTGRNTNGCVGTDTVQVDVYVDCTKLAVPSIFSPNETGPEVNNTFGLIGSLPCVSEYMLVVFNRWGEQVFESQDTKVKWDGTFHGKPQNSGVYFYRMEMTLLDGEKVEKSGNITLIR